VVVAVIDSGGTDHSDLGILSSITGAWISKGYTFISDCRSAGTCAFSTLHSAAQQAPTANAYDLGDGVTDAELLSADTDLKPTGSPEDCIAAKSSWHGTFLSGIIAAQKNTVGLVGAAYNARVLPVRVLGKCGGLTSDIVMGMRWAAGFPVTGVPTNPHPAKILVLSLGASGACSQTEQEAIDDVVKAGAVVLVAAGNENINLDTTPVTPAVCNNATTITGHDRQGLHASYANYGNAVFMSGPSGREEVTGTGQGAILSASNNGATTLGSEAYFSAIGTSFSPPHVAAAVALMREKYPDLTPSEVRWALRQSARPFLSDMCSTVAHRCGAGLLDADQAIVWAGQAVAVRGTPAAIPNDFVATNWTSASASKGGCTIGRGSDHGIVISLLLACIAMMRSFFRGKRLTLGQ
jgi:serine protease